MNIDKFLSPTEKLTSRIIEVKDKPVRRILNTIIAIKDLNEDEKNDKIVRVILMKNRIIKLQSFDNGTPYIFVFDREEQYLEGGLDVLCTRENLVFTVID